jgi:hypothetical protein
MLLVSLVGVVAVAIWLTWKPLLAWYFVRGLTGADEKNREKWVKRVAWLDCGAVPALLECLGRDDSAACANVQAALIHLTRDWGRDDPRCLDLAGQLLAKFESLSAPGRVVALEWQIAALTQEDRPAADGPVATVGVDLLGAACRRRDKGILSPTLALADLVMDRIKDGPALGRCRDLVRAGLAEAEVETRVRAVHLTLHKSLRADLDLLREVVPLLHDPEPVVRRDAMLAVGPAAKVIGEEELLPMLHDGDADVRRLCETALRSRGLRDEQIILGRFLSDRRAGARLNVLSVLERIELEPGETATWLRRLGQDPSPAVRAAVARAAANQTEADLRDLLRQLADGDESPTVRQLAGYYLRR